MFKIHFDGKKGPLTSFSVVSYKKCLGCRGIWLMLDGEERNVAQHGSSDSMEIAKISNMQISLIIEVVNTRHSQIAV
jgi:hypothetical protein